MDKLFNKFLGAESHAAKSPFDLSSRQVYSTKVGLLNVATYIHTMGDSTYSIDMEHVCRTQPLETAAFTKFSSHYEWFFVPYNDLYHSFNQVLAQREDKQSVTSPSLEMPYFNLKEFLRELLPLAAYDYLVSIARLEPATVSPPSNAKLYFANPHMFNDRGYAEEVSFSLANRTDPNYRQLYHLSREFSNESVALGIIRNLDMMGYGNYLPIVKNMAYSVLSLISILHPDDNTCDYGEVMSNLMSISNRAGIDGVLPWIKNYLFEIPDSLFGTATACNLWLPLAYNKVYEQVYRNPYYDFVSKFSTSPEYYNFYGPLSQDFEYVQLFNLDDVKGELQNLDRLFHIFAPHYHQYHKDMFTGVLPDTQFGDVSVLTDDRSWLQLHVSYTNHGGDPQLDQQVYVGQKANDNSYSLGGLTQSTSGQQYYSPDTKFRFDPALAMSILNLRKAEALQRFSENMMRAGNRTRDAFRAHFGFTPLSESRNNVLSLGTFDGDIDLNVVASTSDTQSVQLGQLAANGVGVIQGKTIKFNSHDFGVLVCINYIHKPAEYDAYGLDKLNQNLDPFDYPYNEFQNISLVPLESTRLGYQLWCQNYERIYDSSMDDYQSPDPSSLTRVGILGYLPAFIERKTNVDKIHGEFFSAYPFLPQTSSEILVNKVPALAQGDFSHFVTPRQDNNFSETTSWLYINPNSVDNVFALKSTANQSTDQFFVNLNVKVYATQPLSVIGLPY